MKAHEVRSGTGNAISTHGTLAALDAVSKSNELTIGTVQKDAPN